MGLLRQFASNLRSLRERRGMSQRALADKTRLSISYISMLERGQRSPPLETVERIARALQLRPARLLGFK